jgi:hypothetical protein
MSTLQMFLSRVVRTALLDPVAYEEVERDESATGQAMLVVVLSSLAAGVGVRGWHPGDGVISSFAVVGVISVMAWAASALVIFEMGSRLLPAPDTRTDVAELLRTLGFASAPGLLRVLGVLPTVTGPVFVISGLWTLAATVMAVRQALDFTSTARAIAVCVAGWILSLVLAVVLGLISGPVLL